MDGIDISRWQAGIDLSAVGADFVIVQASKGLATENAYWQDQAEDALESGKLLGFYHYAKTYGWQDEADFFLYTIRPYIGRCAIFLDWEGDAVDNGADWAESWLDYVAYKTGATPGIYMSGWLTSQGMDSIAAKYPLWLANYTVDDYEGYQDADHCSTGAWDAPTLHQYTAHGRLDGYERDLDLDRFFGTTADWERLAGGNKLDIQCNYTSVNYNARGTVPKWIVIHNTANGTSAEGTAYNNTAYFKGVNRSASAHLFVDDGDTVWRCVRDTDTAWHCGDSTSRNGAYNSNAIGIEVCEPSGGEFTAKEKATLRELVTMLMDEYGIDSDHVCRHYDVTGKRCPWFYADDDGAWNELKEYITGKEGITMSELNDWAATPLVSGKMVMNGTTNTSPQNLLYWSEVNGEQTLAKVKSLETKLDALTKKVEAINGTATVTATVDNAKLAAAVADEIYKRMKA